MNILNLNQNIMIVQEQLLLGIYSILLIEVGLILLIVVIVLWDIKRTLDKVKTIVDKLLSAGNLACETVEGLYQQLGSLSALGKCIPFASSIASYLASIKNKKVEDNPGSDALSEALEAIPKKKKRII